MHHTLHVTVIRGPAAFVRLKAASMHGLNDKLLVPELGWPVTSHGPANIIGVGSDVDIDMWLIESQLSCSLVRFDGDDV